MNRLLPLTAVLAACSAGTPARDLPDLPPVVQAPYVSADVAFLTDMITHHAQAVLIAGWAPSHGASPSVRILCERIVVAQRDEIVFMRRWLADRGHAAPDPAGHHTHALMPGMLSAQQLARLDQARGAEFDRLFLTYMIQHHEGALTMVQTLFGSYGAAQDPEIFKFASDVHADQATEIDRMTLMLTESSSEETPP